MCTDFGSRASAARNAVRIRRDSRYGDRAANVSTRTTIVLSTPYENRAPDL